MTSPLLALALAALAAEPLSLERAIEVALERNADVVNAAIEVDAAKWSRISGLSSAGPRVRLEGGVQRWDKPLSVSFSIPGLPEGPALNVRDQVTSSASVTVVQPIISLWPILEGLHVKELGVDIARLKQLQARRDVTFQTTDGFYRVLQAQRLAQISEQSVAQVERQAARAAASERQGVLGRNDVLRVGIALASAKQRLLQVKGGEALATARLRVLLRLAPDEPLTLVPAAAAPTERPSFDLDRARQRAVAQRSELTQVAAQVGQARADVKVTQQTAERMRNLHKENALSQAELEKAEAMLATVTSGARMAEAQVAMADSTVGLAREAVNNRRLTTPIAGTVTRRSVNVGTFAAPGVPAFQVQDASSLKLEGLVDAADFVRLKVGQQVDVRADSLPRALFAGAIATLSPTLDPQTRRAAVEISIDNQGGQLLANMLGSAEIKLGTVDGVLTIPAVAVVSLPTGNGVYVARGGRAAVLQASAGQLELGSAEGGFIEVRSGLTEADQVIVSDQNMLSNGTELTIASAKPAAEQEP